MKENMHEDDRKAAKTPSMIYYVKWNDCILGIHPWQNEHQRFFVLAFVQSKWRFVGTFINEVLAACMGQRGCATLPTRSWLWASMKHKQFLSCITGNWSGNWVWTFINAVLSPLKAKRKRDALRPVLKFSVNAVWMYLGLASWVIFVALDHRHPSTSSWQPL